MVKVATAFLILALTFPTGKFCQPVTLQVVLPTAV